MAARKSNTTLQVMMAAASLVGFLGGWVMLGHAPKPGTVVQPTTISASNSANGGLVPLQSASISSGLRLRTRGS